MHVGRVAAIWSSGDPREPSEGHFDDNCRKYAEARNRHIDEQKLSFATLTSQADLFWCFEQFFGYELDKGKAGGINTQAHDMWWKLDRNEIKALPNLRQIQGDFKTFDDLLAHATGTHTTVANFLFEPLIHSEIKDTDVQRKSME